jgi:hypothetical protein
MGLDHFHPSRHVELVVASVVIILVAIAVIIACFYYFRELAHGRSLAVKRQRGARRQSTPPPQLQPRLHLTFDIPSSFIYLPYIHM